MTFFEPLDLQGILINSLAGSTEIFMFLAFVTIGGMASVLRIPRGATIILLALFAVIFADFFPAIYLLVVVIAGMLSANAVSRVITR